jgi:hypothetical protein
VSEYQYYEFVALDQALTAKQQGELRAVSSRGRITSSGFVNDYQWGDLKADPAKWMERYFDAHLYLANWGTRRIMLRLPKAVLALETAEAFGTPCRRSWSFCNAPACPDSPPKYDAISALRLGSAASEAAEGRYKISLTG